MVVRGVWVVLGQEEILIWMVAMEVILTVLSAEHRILVEGVGQMALLQGGLGKRTVQVAEMTEVSALMPVALASPALSSSTNMLEAI
ncbi:MAG: hypothetical protein V1882_05580 [Candidatus Omnitrophota bacterium]